MLKENETYLNYVEQQYPGIKEQIYSCERTKLPACSYCGSPDTAQVITGLIGRTICLAGAMTKVKLVPNKKESVVYFCNACKEYL